MLSIPYVFGRESYQDENFLYISKTSYPEFSAKNFSSGQKILAILLKSWIKKYFGSLEDHQNEKIVDHENREIKFDHSTIGNLYISQAREKIEEINGRRLRIIIVKVAFRFPDAGSGIHTFESSVF